VPAGLGDEERGRELFVLAGGVARRDPQPQSRGERLCPRRLALRQLLPGAADAPRPIIDRPDRSDGQLLNQLPGLVGTVGDAQASDSARAVALAWVLHLVGDAHQPLHNSARITPQDTAGDRGGNLFLLGGLYPRNNLHAFWDAIVGFDAP
jgi:hypothetical protein